MLLRMRSKLRRKWNQRRREGIGKYLIFHGSKENYISNGAWILEQSISMFHGRANPIRHISVDDLNNIKVEGLTCHSEFYYDLYRGSWEGRAILVKKPNDNNCLCRKNYLLEIVVATQMATHRNALKLLACCLETKNPVLIYEWVLPKIIDDAVVRELEWEDRLRIAWEISHAIAHLHTAFPRPIVHSELMLGNVFLDQSNTAKVCDFSLCASIPEGEEFVEEPTYDYDSVDIDTTYCYWIESSSKAPEQILHGRVAQSSDVFSFGTILLTLLRGKKMCPSCIYNCTTDMFCVEEMVDPVLTRNEISSIKRLQLQTTMNLALHCFAREGDQRPSMVEVAAVLKNMITSPESVPDTSSFKIEHDMILRRPLMVQRQET